MDGVRGYIDEGEVIKVENCRRKCRETEVRIRERSEIGECIVDIVRKTLA
jgi:hypothetical protein